MNYATYIGVEQTTESGRPGPETGLGFFALREPATTGLSPIRLLSLPIFSPPALVPKVRQPHCPREAFIERRNPGKTSSRKIQQRGRQETPARLRRSRPIAGGEVPR